MFNEEYEEEEGDDYLAFNITDEKNDVASVSNARTDACIVNVQIDGVRDCEALIDSGSSVNIVGGDVLRCLRNNGRRNKRLEAIQSRLYAYGNTELLSWASFRPGLASLARPRPPASSSSLGK